ncbi:MAG TPA: hypothetical protein VFB12_25510 [Ktedonobacteraceae bacterium]|nr:hypothetical protein [Ktedonobacteraceae bacterium]
MMNENWIVRILNCQPGAHPPRTLKRHFSARPPTRDTWLTTRISINLLTDWLITHIARENWSHNSS